VARIDGNKESRLSRVLRATDVIPPYDKAPPQVDEPDNGAEGPTLAQARQQQPKRERKVARPPEMGSDGGSMGLAEQTPAPPVIPTFDLAEHILAEHRRTAAQRRKAPGQMQAEPETVPERAAANACVIEPPLPPLPPSPPSAPSQDLLELHRVVAEIVARDIERLCRQPSRPPCD
jgi:hypothetical protein